MMAKVLEMLGELRETAEIVDGSLVHEESKEKHPWFYGNQS